MPVNVKKYIDKLIQALEVRGKHYNLSSKRFFSSNVNRYVTKYTLESVEDKSVKMEVYNKLEILKFLVREYSKEVGQEIPEGCREVMEGDPPPKKRRKTAFRVFDNFKKKMK